VSQFHAPPVFPSKEERVPGPDTPGGEPAPAFERHRRRLFGLAYRMLGSPADAEDAVQEAYLRWHAADRAAIESPEAWLVAVTTRLCLDRLRRAATERASYPGPWLPEPIVAGDDGDASHGATLASDLSTAFLVLLERLAPEERAAFLLREVFDTDYAEIAHVLGRSEPASRQVVHRARARVREGRPRFAAAAGARRELLERFRDALARGDEAALLDVLAPDARLVADGGGKVSAAPRPVEGAPRIAKFLLGLEKSARGHVSHVLETINGECGLVSLEDGHVFCTTSADVDAGRIRALYRVLNPEKLARFRAARVTR
jgi:RNA polymerase sigma-70 factor (ECF subfamily)